MEKESVYHLIRDVATTYAERPMYWVKDESGEYNGIRYAEWYEDLKKLSCYLISEGVKKGDKVGYLCDNRYEWLLCSLGVVTIGAVDVPRGCDATPEDIKYILNHTEAGVVILENEKVLKKITNFGDEYPHIKTVILIENEDKFKNLDEHKKKLSKAKFIFLREAIALGESFIKKKGAKEYEKRGEACELMDLATIIYTSGTTGAPKGVMLTHRAFTWEIHQLQNYLPISYLDRTLIFLPPWHIAERLLETALISWGASMATSSIPTIPQDIQKVKPTVLVSVPRLWEGMYKKIFDNVKKAPPINQKLFNFAHFVVMKYRNLLDTALDNYVSTIPENESEKMINRIVAAILLIPFFPLNKIAQIIMKKVRNVLGGQMRFALCGAGAMPENVSVFFRSIGIPIIETYGMTETTGVSCLGAAIWPKIGAIGKVMPGVQVKLLDEKNRVVTKPGDKGVAWHKGPHITIGYYKNEEKTKATLIDGWLDSGDILTWTTTGELKFAGRAKDTIVLSGGENLEPGPIEGKLAESNFVNQVIVVGQDRKNLGAIIVPAWDAVKEHFKTMGKDIKTDPKDWNKDPAIVKFYKDIIKEKVNNDPGFKVFEKVSNLHILHKEFEKGIEMTETMKLKRNVIFDMYAKEIDDMYRSSKDD
ncbi:MAG: AMP-binding protein [Leptospiraceae bacterium]|nr:AMP-binding protein [Leptospiraceae bacterium]MCK6381246.1 AMP-binding protein [Leptospiraceae bacterium]NUM42335.1 AMP-binding protein [Leptospiraceae bacterium]